MTMKKFKFILLSQCFLLLGSAALLAQSSEVTWAKQIEYQYNEFDSEEGAAKNLIGPPSATPYGKSNSNTFRLKTKNGFGRIIVSFGGAVPAKKVIIFENHLPGRINKVIVYDQFENKHLLFDGGFKISLPYRALQISVPSEIKLVSKVEVSMLAYYEEGHPEIDAIGLSNSDDPSLGEKILQSMGQMFLVDKVGANVKKVNLGNQINSLFTEVKPIIAPSGDLLYFSRQNHPENFNGKDDDQDVFYTVLNNNVWSKAQNMGHPINDRHPNGIVSVSADGNLIYLINEYTKDDTYKKGLSVSHKVNGAWQKPEKVHVRGLYNFSGFVDYVIDAGGQHMIISLNRLDSRGDSDLYISFNEGNNVWTAPKNLGKVINTSKADFAPFLASDGKTLYFSSYGHKGYGDSDIFMTRRLDASWTNWSEPVNLGPLVNSSGFDAYFTIPITGNYAYMVSDQGSINNSKDIFRVELDDEFLPYRTLKIIGQVFDQDSMEPLDAALQFAKDNQIVANTRSAKDLGAYEIILEPGSSFQINVQSEGYSGNVDFLDLPLTSEGVIVKNIYLKKNELGNPGKISVGEVASYGTFRFDVDQRIVKTIEVRDNESGKLMMAEFEIRTITAENNTVKAQFLSDGILRVELLEDEEIELNFYKMGYESIRLKLNGKNHLQAIFVNLVRKK
jgi:hypothetical protein